MNKERQHKASINEMIVKNYEDGFSIKEIVKRIGVSEVKVRRVLITEGLWSSPTSEEIYNLYQDGMTPIQIAEKLQKPLKSIQAYMPYTRGEYNDVDVSPTAQWSRAYRKRKQSAMNRQVRCDTKKVVREAKSSNNDKLSKNLIEQEDKLMINVNSVNKNKHEKNDKMVLKLHLELQMELNENEKEIIKKYGKSKNGISRDILVPSEMMLHNLHYAIQQAFGWQNSHLHKFSYPENIFMDLTNDRLINWLDFCGLYFRFPDEENEDIYWDDDYDGSISPKSWLRKKYTRPYYYGGISEHYMFAQTQARMFKKNNQVINVRPSFEEFASGKTEIVQKDIEDITVKEINTFFDCSMNELLERLPLSQVIGPNLKKGSNKVNELTKIVSKANIAFSENYNEYCELYDEEDDYELENMYQKTDIEIIPLSDTLIYKYDYGDGWQVSIKCTDAYEYLNSKKKSPLYENEKDVTNEEHSNEQVVIDSKGNVVYGELRGNIDMVLTKTKPLCIEADGLPVMDDVGGPHGYIEFLACVNGQNYEGSQFDDKESSIEWGHSMGWTGKMNKPEKII